MRALVYRGPRTLILECRPDPQPGPGEAVLKVEACGICGTDLRIMSGSHRAYPRGTVRTPGHEIAGRIVDVGPDCAVAIGAAAFVAPNIGCDACPQCKAGRTNLCEHPRALGITENGGMAEYVLLPSDLVTQGNVLALPDGIDPGAAALIEPLACVLRGSMAVKIQKGDTALICGAGPIGLLHLLVAKLAQPQAIIVSEPAEERRSQAKAWGADVVVDPISQDLSAVVSDVSAGRGADAIVVAAPSTRAQEQSVELAASGCRINFFGGLPKDDSRINLDSNPIHYKEILLTGTTANSTQDCRMALGLLLSGAIETGRLISDRRPLTESDQAFEAASGRNSLKVVLEP